MNAPATLAQFKPDIAAVQHELSLLRDQYLPVLLQPITDEPMTDAMLDKLEFQRIEIDQSETDWRDALDWLDRQIPLTPVPSRQAPLNADYVRDFMRQEAVPGYAVEGERIHWDIALFMVRPETRFLCRRYFADGRHGEFSRAELLAALPQVKQWLMRLPIDEPYLWNTLTTHLPAIADVDPAFAKFVLDPETWQTRVRADAALGAMARAERLSRVEAQMQRTLNAALLHVIGALANNHFSEIAALLDHPYLKGPATNLMPHYLFAVLFEKVNILRKLTAQ